MSKNKTRRSFLKRVLHWSKLLLLAKPTVYFVGHITAEKESGFLVAGAKTLQTQIAPSCGSGIPCMHPATGNPCSNPVGTVVSCCTGAVVGTVGTGSGGVASSSISTFHLDLVCLP